MGVIHRVRVAAVGSRADMIRLNRVLLRNLDWLEEPEDRPPFTLRELRETIAGHMEHEAGDENAFLYEMLSPAPYGSALPGSRFELVQLEDNLFIAGFSYDSSDRLQPEDWLRLHRDCDNLPLFIIHAANDFTMDKGGLCITNGEIRECWDRMAEVWLWLFEQYGAGHDPESAVRRLELLDVILRHEEWDQDIAELLNSCIRNLVEIDRAMDSISGELIREAAAGREWGRLLDMHALVADSWLWETRHNAKWLACLRLAITSWENLHTDRTADE